MRYDREVSHTMNIISVLFCLLLLLLLSVRHLHYKSFPNSLDWTFNYTWECVQRLHETATQQPCLCGPGLIRDEMVRFWLSQLSSCRQLMAGNWSKKCSAQCSMQIIPPPPSPLLTSDHASLVVVAWAWVTIWWNLIMITNHSSPTDHFALDFEIMC